MRMVLIGDIHLYSLWTAPWSLFGKRVLGQSNLWLRRRRRFNPKLLAPTIDHAASLEPDMVLLSGDVSTTALPSEFRAVARVLKPLFDAAPTVMVPGNHDRYTFTSKRRRTMERAFPDHVPDRFPSLSPIADRWHLLALDSAVPRVVSSRGRVGTDQLTAASGLVAGVPSDHGLIVLTHYALKNHPGKAPMASHHQLSDADQFRELLADCPARTLFMHGHIHQPWVWQWDEPKLEHVIDVNAGAPVMCTSLHPFGQGFWQFDLPDAPDKPITFHNHVLIQEADGEKWDIRTSHVAAI